ncbi:MAG TPA: RluA family pseudouridine synthase [Thermoanaerobaculia bacterium]|nr:RluA family pseudouridine synthase [Thermoanaerobaculia bacterium]
MRLDQRVAKEFGLSRRAARDAVRSGRVEVAGGAAAEPGIDVPEEAAVAYFPNRPPLHRVRTRLTVLYEDDDLLIVDKPAGLLSVPTPERESDTLLARVLDYLQHRYRRRPYAGVVHRLDRDTSGSIVFARSREILHGLQELFRAHDIEREYLAIVEGAPAEAGTLDAELVRDAGLGRRGVAKRGEQGRRAVTRYRVRERLHGASLVSITLETGRTHQIRIHFAAEGHPVVGDRVYRRRPGEAAAIDAPRQMLHARRLGFTHPRTRAVVRVESPVPEDFEKVLENLRKRRPAQPGRAAAPSPRRAGEGAERNAPPRRGVQKRFEGKGTKRGR